MNIKKEAFIVKLPTYGDIVPSILLNNSNGKYTTPISNNTSEEFREIGWQTFNLYVISDDEIKNKDNFHNPHTNQLHIAGTHTDYIAIRENGCKKIISATDKSLKCHGCKNNMWRDLYKCSCLPKPSKSFIEKYCKLGGIDKVLVSYEDINKVKVDVRNEISIHSIEILSKLSKFKINEIEAYLKGIGYNIIKIK